MNWVGQISYGEEMGGLSMWVGTPDENPLHKRQDMQHYKSRMPKQCQFTSQATRLAIL